MTTACVHDRIDHNRGTIVCLQCRATWAAPSGYCKCGKPLDDPPHKAGVPCR